MIRVRTVRAHAALRALAVLAVAVVLGLVWAPDPSVPAPRTASVPTPVDLGPYALADTGLLGIPVAPPPPGNVRAVPHDRSASVTWDAATPSTSTVRSYRIYVDGVQRGPDVPGSQRSTTVYGLTNYQQQRVNVHTVDSDPRESGDSNDATVVPYDDAPPSAVTGLVATRGDGQVTLTWESESAAESDRAGVRVYVDGSLRTSLPAATTTYQVTGLSNDVEHTFHLVAFDARPNGYGPAGSVAPNASAPSATVRATPTDLTPPSAPTAFAAVRGDATAALTWTAPPEGDVGLYKVVDENGVLVASFTATATSGTATAMTNGRAYRLRIVAVDTRGNHSPASAEVTVTPATPPIARTGLTAARGDGRVTLAWNPRVVDPARAAAATLRVSVDGALVATLPGTATSYTATGLTDDRAYAFSVVGVDDRGRAGPAATVNATPTDLTPPSAPAALAAARGDTTADLSWTAPPETDVGTYLVLAQDGSTVATIAAPASARTLTGLADGTTYRLRLVAVDTHGNRSAPSNEVTVTPLAPPLAITGLAVTAKGTQATLTWSAPASAPDHEKAVQVQVWRVGPPDELLATVPASQRSYQWKGYAAGSAESFYVVAVDGDPRSSEPSAIVSTVLAPPTGVTATVESQRTRISWETVLGASGYRVERVDGGGAVMVGTTSDAFLDVTGLTNGTAHTFRVLAVDGKRSSAPSQEVVVTPLDLPAVVQGLRAERQGSDVVLSWAVPATPPSDVAATARVQVFQVGAPEALGTVPAGTTTFIVTGAASADPSPSFYLVAADAGGRASPASATVSAALGAPQGIRGTSGPQRATVGWTSVPGAASYRVERLVGSTWTEEQVTAQTSLTVTGLTDGTAYTFRVVATAPAGGPAGSAPSAEVTIIAGHTPHTTVPTGGSGGAIGVAASRDGRFAVLAVPAAAAKLDLVRVDRLGTGRTVIASGIPTQEPGLARAAVSGDGRYVALVTRASHDLRDVNGRPDVYRYDITDGAWALVSAPPPPSAGDRAYRETADVVPGLSSTSLETPDKGPMVAITADGSRVFFLSARNGLVSGDTDGSLDLFSKDVASGAVTRVTATTAERPTGTGFTVTPDGRYALYGSNASSCSLVRQETVAPEGRVCVTASDGGPLNQASGVGQTAVSDDGRRVLAIAVVGTTPTLFQADLASPAPPTGTEPAGRPSTVRAALVVRADYGAGQVALDPAGASAFLTTKAALLSADTNGHVDVYRVDLADPSNRVLVTAGPDGGPAVIAGQSTSTGFEELGAITAQDADHVVVVTQRPLIAGDTNRLRDAYAVDLSVTPPERARPLVAGP